jgi:carbon monoxide dehydrogenase subunit G
VKIEHEFTVAAGVQRAWAVLTDIPGIVPCMPGAQLVGLDPGEDGTDVYRGKVKVRIGPVVSEYAGTATFLEKDDDAHRAVIDAKGRDSRGAGNAAAAIVVTLRSSGSGDDEKTTVSLDTELKISGKIAQFGSSMIREVSEKLLGQFVACLEGQLQAPAGLQEPVAEAAVEPAATAAGTARPVFTPSPEVEALDLMDVAGGAAAKRLIPALIGVGLVVAAIIIYRLRR